MNLYYNTALVLHIIGMCIMVGGTIAQFAGLRFFWKQYAQPGERAAGLLAISLLPGRFTAAGFLLLLASGTGMLYLNDWVYTEQAWFRAKFTIIVVVMIISIALQSRQERVLLKLVSGSTADPRLPRARRGLDARLLLELGAFLCIFVLAIFKFNPAPAPTLSASPRGKDAGAKVYQANCLACHGTRGDAGIGGAANLRLSGMNAREVRKIIREGRNRMPAFANRFETGRLDALVQYIIQLREKQNESTGNH